MNIVKYYNGKELTMIIESISIRLLQDLKKEIYEGYNANIRIIHDINELIIRIISEK